MNLKKDIIITNKKRFDMMKEGIIKDGVEKLQVLADFDKTLTSCFVDGKKIVSLISILRDEHYLTPDYSEKAHALYNKYHPYEMDPNLSLEEKKKLMHEWWKTHYDLLIKSGLSKDDLKKVANSQISFRSGALEFFKILDKLNIPLIILSAAGLGAETISLYLERFNIHYKNIHVVSNEFIWGDDGKVAGVREPIIHNFNKDYTSVKKFTFYDEIKNRRNVILLGDSISDTMMLNGYEYDKVMKIGFLSDDAEDESVQLLYEKAFDVLVLDDGPMDFVNELLGSLVMGKLEKLEIRN
ncbi:MAG: hypothetical protein V1770_04545 [bacterium]